MQARRKDGDFHIAQSKKAKKKVCSDDKFSRESLEGAMKRCEIFRSNKFFSRILDKSQKMRRVTSVGTKFDNSKEYFEYIYLTK